jgi:hypothetical protein
MIGVDTTSSTGPHRRARAVNRRTQGDIGEVSAMEWLTSRGATVWIPLNHSPHVDLMAEWDDRLISVQGENFNLPGTCQLGRGTVADFDRHQRR